MNGNIKSFHLFETLCYPLNRTVQCNCQIQNTQFIPTACFPRGGSNFILPSCICATTNNVRHNVLLHLRGSRTQIFNRRLSNLTDVFLVFLSSPEYAETVPRIIVCLFSNLSS